MKIPATLLLNYQIEYETTDITIDALCAKYDITTSALKGHQGWTKRTIETTTHLPSVPTSEHKLVSSKPSNKQIIDNIQEFKELAMEHALKFMRNDAEFAEVKEFKDMVSIVGTIEASYKDDKPENTINIAIQNIVKDFTDDC